MSDHFLKQYIKIKNKIKGLHGGFDWNRIFRSLNLFDSSNKISVGFMYMDT